MQVEADEINSQISFLDHRGQKIESAQKIHASSGRCNMHAHFLDVAIARWMSFRERERNGFFTIFFFI